MNGRRLNRELAAARGKAASLEPLLVKAWASVIDAMGQRAVVAFTSGRLTAAATPEDPLFGSEPEKLAAKTRRARERVLAAAATIEGITFDVQTATSQAFLESLGPRTDTVIEGIRPVVEKAITEGFEEGLSVPDTASLIRAEVGAIKDWQATALARTDLNALANAGNHLAVLQLNAASSAAGEQEFVSKRWLTAEDERVRPAHKDADGQVVPIGQPFTVGSEPLDFPGDPTGSPENTWNCRCVTLYLAEIPVALAASAATVTEDETGGAMSEKPTIMMMADRGKISRKESMTAASVTVITEEPAAAAGVPQAWTADLAFEGVPTDDGRWMVPGSLTWREPPMTLLALTENTEGGHLGADSAGSIQEVSKRGIGVTDLGEEMSVIPATGVFDSGEFGQETARMVDEGTLGYVSVDLAIQEDGFRNPDTGEILNPAEMTEEQWMEAFMGGLQYAVLAGVIGAATVVPFSAFAESRISMSAAGEKHLTLRAPISLVRETLRACAAGPLDPPSEWFENPRLTEPTLLTVTPEGRVYGHAATWDCHTGFADRCLRASPSRNGYAMFHCGQLRSAAGDLVRVGRITVAPHAAAVGSPASVTAYYDDASRVAAFVRAYDDGFGIAVAGVTRSDAAPELLRDFLANPPSGDWRRGELLGFSSVPHGGLPVIVPEARLVASADGEMIVDWLRLPPVTEMDVLLAAITEDGEDFRVVIEALAASIAGETPEPDPVDSSETWDTDADLWNEQERKESEEPQPVTASATGAVADPTPDPPEIDPNVERAIEQLRLVTQKERFEGYKLGIDLGILTLNDCLVAEGREPLEEQRPVASQDAAEPVDPVTPALVSALEGITGRLAAGDRLNEGMVQALRDLATRPPRKLTVERDAEGHAVAYQEA